LTGIGRYTLELARRLPKHPNIRRLSLVRGSERVRSVDGLLRSAAPTGKIWRSIKRRSARLAVPLRPDIVHGPNYSLPRMAGCGVVTFHDLSVFRFPHLHPAARVAEFEKNIRQSIDRADHLITDCDTIRQEVIEFTGVPADRVTAVPLGISEVFRPISLHDREAVLRRHGLPMTGYGLTISTLEPRKRIDRLLVAWRQMPRQIRDRYPLVIAGASGWNNDELHMEIQRAADEGWALTLGFVPEVDLPAIYAGATVFAYPSVYEGFGLPPLEAMASGVPAVVSAGSCLPEVTKGAAMVANPDDIPGFADLLLRSLEDEIWRNEAISAGIQVAAGYKWTRCVDETIAVYQRVTSSGA